MKSWIFKYRGLLWGIFALAVFLFPVSYSSLRTLLSVPFLIAGQALRFWAAGIIPKYRTLVLDAPVLVTWGPYAWVRNPLYAGNALLGIGWSLLVGWLWVPVFAAVFFFIYGLVIIPDEERFLQERFGDEYLRFKESTPALFPRWFRFSENRNRSIGNFDRQRSWFMERHSLRMNIAVTVLIFVRLFLLHY